MKKVILLLFVTISISQLAFSQVGISAVERGKLKRLDKGVLEKFKKSKTIFVLTEAFDQDSLENILDKYWKVTPYEMVSYKDFNKYDYANGNYSFAVAQGYKTKVVNTKIGKRNYNNSGTTYLHTFLSLRMYNFDDIKKHTKPRHLKRKINPIESKYTQFISRIEFFPNSEFILKSIVPSITPEALYEQMMTENVFYNNTLGHFKNNIQKLNNLLIQGEEYWMFENDYMPELKRLSSSKLYVPKYAVIKYNPFKGTEEVQGDAYEKKLFKAYDFEYEIIDSKQLDEKILNSEDVFYLRYVRVNGSKFIHVVNAKTGEVVYRKFINGLMVYNLKSKHIKELNSKIKKLMKK